MIHCAYNKNDLRYIFYWGDNISANTPKQKREKRPSLEEHLNKIPSYMFLPSFSGIPRPEVFLNKFRKNDNIIYYTYAGLWKEVSDWCANNHIDLQIENDDFNYFKYTDFSLTLEQFTDLVHSWELSLTPYDYQIKAAWLILKYRVSMSQLATRAGKTLIAYMVFRYMLESKRAHNILMIVPNITLVKQGVKDMSEYKEFFTTETVWANGEYCEMANLTIGTFQSLVNRLDKKNKKYNPKFFEKFDVICCDECHTAKCESIKKILTQECMKNVKLRFGFSGTVPLENSIESFTCQSLLGPKIQDIRSSELVNEGFLASVDMTQVYVHYAETPELTDKYIKYGEYLCANKVIDKDGKEVILPKEEQDFTMRHVKKLPFAMQQIKQCSTKEEYRDYLVDMCKAKGSNLLMLEEMLIHHAQERIEAMDKIISGINKNVIVFAHHTEYLKYLKEHLEQKFPDRKVLIIYGATSVKKRAEYIEYMLHNDNVILCASYACCGTGLTFKNLDYGIYMQSFKSRNINLQSIGRGMLKTDTKDTFYMYDIVDVLPTGRLAGQGRAKNKLYKQENYNVHVISSEQL